MSKTEIGQNNEPGKKISKRAILREISYVRVRERRLAKEMSKFKHYALPKRAELKRETERLIEERKAIGNTKPTIADVKHMTRLSKKLSRDFNTEQSCQEQIKALEKRLVALNKEYDEVRKKAFFMKPLIGDSGLKAQHLQSMNRKRMILINDLQSITKRFDSVLCENGESRKAIQAVLLQRQDYQDDADEILHKTHAARIKLSELTKEARLQYEELDDNLVKITTLQDVNNREKIRSRKEYSDLTLKITNTSNLIKYCKTRENRRSESRKLEAEKKQKMVPKFRNVADPTVIAHTHYSLERVLNASETESATELAGLIDMMEEKRFTLVRYLNDISSVAKAWKDAVESRTFELEKMKINHQKALEEKLSKKKILEDKIRRTQNEYNDCMNKKSTKIEAILEPIFQKVKDIVQSFDLNDKIGKDYRDEEGQLQLEHLITYMKVVEELANDLMLMMMFKKSHNEYGYSMTYLKARTSSIADVGDFLDLQETKVKIPVLWDTDQINDKNYSKLISLRPYSSEELRQLADKELNAILAGLIQTKNDGRVSVDTAFLENVIAHIKKWNEGISPNDTHSEDKQDTSNDIKEGDGSKTGQQAHLQVNEGGERALDNKEQGHHQNYLEKDGSDIEEIEPPEFILGASETNTSDSSRLD